MNSTTVLILGTDSAFMESSHLISVLRGSQAPLVPIIKMLPETATDQWEAELDQVLRQSKPDVALFAPNLDHAPAASRIFGCMRESGLSIPVLVLIGSAEPEEVTSILNAGASDFARLPLEAADLLPRLCRLRDSGLRDAAPEEADSTEGNEGNKEKRRNDQPAPGRSQDRCRDRAPARFEVTGESDTLITRNVEFRRQLQQLSVYAKHDVTVLITGETGTGKELVARALHRLSARVRKTFLPVNCGAIPAELIENEFFGHESEAFTGASSRRSGLVSEAEGGTLFLDEIDSAPSPFQAKLLRLLQNQEYRPVGSTKLCHANVRVIAAANSDLEAGINAGKFRRDLYYRLNVVRLDLPPLRKRMEDIPLLAQHFVEKYSIRFGKRVRGISNSAVEVLLSYGWPGNIRELENVIERGVILCQDDDLSPLHIDLPTQARGCDTSFRALKAAAIEEFERAYLVRLLTEHRGNITKAALAAGKHRRALFHLIQKHGIHIAAGDDRARLHISFTKPDDPVRRTAKDFEQEGAEKRR